MKTFTCKRCGATHELITEGHEDILKEHGCDYVYYDDNKPWLNNAAFGEEFSRGWEIYRNGDEYCAQCEAAKDRVSEKEWKNPKLSFIT